MKKHEHPTTYRLLLLIFLCSLSKVILADDATTQTWEELAQAPSGWETTPNPYPTAIEITSEAELAWVAKMVNNDEITGDGSKKGFEDVTITLTTDLDLAAHNWIPIGKIYNQYFPPNYPFKGTFDGGNYTISNMKVDTEYQAGLFGNISGATITNIKLENCAVNKTKQREHDGTEVASGLVGVGTKSTIENCTVIQGDISFLESQGGCVGGIIGYGVGCAINKCTFEGKLTSENQDENLTSGSIGGIAGEIFPKDGTISTITDCTANIILTSKRGYAAGGITGRSDGFIKDCSAQGEISITTNPQNEGVGGITGANSPSNTNKISIEGCNSSCKIKVTHEAKTSAKDRLYYAKAGGIVGYHNSNSPIANCIASGTVSVELIDTSNSLTVLNSCCAGGIVGYSDTRSSEIRDCESNANILASSTIQSTTIYAGGIIGSAYSGDYITDCIVSGNISIEGSIIYGGGITGYNNRIIRNCQYNMSVIPEENKSGYSVITDGISAKGRTCYIGGVAGINYKTIKNSYSTAIIVSEASSTNYIGGIVGYNYGNGSFNGEVQDCYSTGNISSMGTKNYTGGIAGINYNLVLNCYATGQVKATCSEGTTSNVGGIAGKNEATIQNCLALNTTGIINNQSNIGRIIGNNGSSTSISNNYAHPEITGNWEDKTATNPNGADWEDMQTYPFAASSAWDFTDNTQLPKLKQLNNDGTYSDMVANQPELPLLNLQSFTITFDTPDNGTLTVTNPDGSSITTGSNVLGGTKLTITATASEGYQVDGLLVNGSPFKSGNVLTVSSNTTIEVTITKKPEPIPDPEPTPMPEPEPIVYYIVTLPEIEGATTDPVAGDYEIEAWDSFRFYLTIDTAYSQSEPIVTTDRGETIEPRSNGAYIINFVRSDIQISIDGIVKNPAPVANETIETNDTKVWAESACLHIHTAKRESILIYSYNGTLLNSFTLLGDQTVYYPQGNYIVVAGGKRFKVQVK